MTAIEQLDGRPGLTANQWKLVVTAAFGTMFELWDQYLIAFVLAFVIRPWGLSFGITAFILLASGIGSIFGGLVWGYVADRWGRKSTFAVTFVVFSLCSLALAFTPEGNWIWLVVFRMLLGFGTGGFFVPIALVQETVPAALRGRAIGIVSATTSAGLLLGALCGAFVVPAIGWRLTFVVGALPAFYAALVWFTIAESPRWAALNGKVELARKSLAWVLGRPVTDVDLQRLTAGVQAPPSYRELLRYPRSIVTGVVVNLAHVTGYYGLVLWSPTLIAQVQGVGPAAAAQIMIGFTGCGIVARLIMSVLSDRFGRKVTGGTGTLLAAAFLLVAGFTAQGQLLPAGFFWLPLLIGFIGADSSQMVLGLYTSEIWPSKVRGVGSGLCFAASGVGKITGPLGLGLIAGSANIILPQATRNAAIPAFAYLASWFAIVSAAFFFLGIETRGRTLEQIEAQLDGAAPATRIAAAK